MTGDERQIESTANAASGDERGAPGRTGPEGDP